MMTDSDDSSLSSVPVSNKKRPIANTNNIDSDSSSEDEAFTYTKRRFSPHKRVTRPDDDDSDSDDSQMKQLKLSKQSRLNKSKISSLLSDDSDSDNDYTTPGSKTSGQSSSLGGAGERKKPVITFDSDDSDNDDEIKVVESEVMKKARLARTALENEPVDLRDDNYDDDNDGDFEINDSFVENSIRMVSNSTNNLKRPAPEPLATGPMIRIQFRASVSSSQTNHPAKSLHGKSMFLPFRTGTKLESVLRIYRKNVDDTITSHANVKFIFDGLLMDNHKSIAQYEMDDEDMIDVTISIPENAPKVTALNIPEPTSAQGSLDAQYVKVITTIKGGDPSAIHNFQLKRFDPFDKLLKTYRDKHGYSSLKRVTLEIHNIQIDTSLSPKDFSFEGSCHIAICDEQERLKQVQKMSQLSTSSYNGIIGSAGGIKLKIRMNGSTKSFDIFSILSTQPFQKLIDLVCQKYNVTSSDCKFIFDGATLNPKFTPNDEDLEGDEVIDVQIDDLALRRTSKPVNQASSSAQNSGQLSSQILSIGSTRTVMVEGFLGVTISEIDGYIRVKSIDTEKMKGKMFPGDKITSANGKDIIGMTPNDFKNFLASIGSKRDLTVQFLGRQDIDNICSKDSESIPVTGLSKSTSRQGSPSEAPIIKSDSLCSKNTISVYVVRNNASSGKARKFRMYSSYKLSKLRQGYLKAYKKNGCQSVQFYVRGRGVSDYSVTIGSLNLQESDRVLAMENGRKL